MTDLQSIKDEIALGMGLTNYEGFLIYIAQYSGSMLCDTTTEFLNKVAKRYAEEALKEAAIRAEVEFPSDDDYLPYVDKESILSLIKEL